MRVCEKEGRKKGNTHTYIHAAICRIHKGQANVRQNVQSNTLVPLSVSFSSSGYGHAQILQMSTFQFAFKQITSEKTGVFLEKNHRAVVSVN